MPNSSPSTIHDPVYSEFADDPDFHDLLDMFMTSMEEQRAEILSLFRNRHWSDLKRIAHQLKGAGGGYGFPGLSEKARELEVAASEQNEAEIASNIGELFAYMDRLST